MKAIERVKALHLKEGAKPLCDDCIAEKLTLSARQESNIISRKLIQTPFFDRVKDICSSCGGTKYVMFATVRDKAAMKGQTLSTLSMPVVSKDVVEVLKPSKSSKDLAHLTDIGFIPIGYWQDSDGRPTLTLHDLQNASPALYAFVENGDVLYVGKTVQALKKRLYFYESPGPTQSTNIRINANIASALEEGREIDMYGYSDIRPIRIGVFDLNLAAALEDSIIKTLNPIWNSRG
ncbi:GIY-YIG nuclease family protein [Fretibacter rubidus]|uniref:GIY-YIG nuclease family protein n=1 Tax=Fretibacter rubidus TaxID=570162 RepID=UPI003529E5E6